MHQLPHHNLLRTSNNIIHLPYPKHLILRFHLLCHTLFLLQLLHKPIQHLIAFLINLMQIFIQLSFKQHLHIISIFYFQKTALEKEMKRVSERIGLKPIRVHDLRHSHASMLIDLGFSPLEIAERLGHESVKTTLDTYSHLYSDKGQQLADRLNQFRNNSTK